MHSQPKGIKPKITGNTPRCGGGGGEGRGRKKQNKQTGVKWGYCVYTDCLLSINLHTPNV